MTTDLILGNLLNWGLQTAALAVLAVALPRVLRMHPARLRLHWLQGVLSVSLLLPAMRPWQQETILIGSGNTTGVTITMGATRLASPSFDPANSVLPIIGIGIALRLIWLLIGFARLRRYRRRSTALSPVSGIPVHESADIAGPLTFGVFNPVILLPTTFQELSSAQQEAVLCHEVTHVQRRDWLSMVAEELLRSVLWFHPAIWWLTAEIRLTREEVVDAEVVEVTRAKDEYVDALLSFAGAIPTPLATMAPGFVRRHHLKQRVINILREVHMSRTRYVSTVLTATAALVGVCWSVTTALPLNAQTQYGADAPVVTFDLAGARWRHRAPVSFPASASNGSVVAQVKLDAAGNVVDASVLSGPDELRRPVLQSVLSWHFDRAEGGSTRQVTVSFEREIQQNVPVGVVRAPNPQTATPRILKDLTVSGLPDSAKQETMASTPAHAGDAITAELASEVLASARKVDEHLGISVRTQGSGDSQIVLAPSVEIAGPSRPGISGGLRVGGAVQAANLVSQVSPVYPPLAKAARVQGTVKLDAVIGKDGHVVNLKLLSGPALLVAAAMEAARQWIYKPTLLNDNPVEVVTSIDINFTLADQTPE